MTAAVSIHAPATRKPAIRLTAYACEALGTAFNLSIGLCAIFFNFGHGLPMERWLPSVSARLLLNGLIFAGSGSLFAISPPGKLSGAHINPAVTLAFFVSGKVRVVDLFGYWIGQFAGAIFATIAMTTLWGRYAVAGHYGMTMPGSGYTAGEAFAAETIMTGLLVLMIFIFVSSHRLMRWTPLMVWLLVAGEVWIGAPISGTSINPARSFGPALIAHDHRQQWIYWLAPCAGALLAVGLFNAAAAERKLLTAKLFQTFHYPSIFKNLHVPHWWGPTETPIAQPN